MSNRVSNLRCSPGVCFPLFFFSVYINEIICNNAILKLIKYADDIVLTACLLEEFSLLQ